MTASGAILREVGTTNRTHLRDYAEAINENTALLLKVHPSNYKLVGFTTAPEMTELTALGAQHGIPTMEDLGSGALLDLTTYGLPHEPVVAERIESGVDIVTFSGDKLLGGPQAGIIVGKAEWIQKIRKNPLMRAVRVDKLTIAALGATLQAYLNHDALSVSQFPMLQRYTRSIEELRETAAHITDKLTEILGETVTITVARHTIANWERFTPCRDITERRCSPHTARRLRRKNSSLLQTGQHRHHRAITRGTGMVRCPHTLRKRTETAV